MSTLIALVQGLIPLFPKWVASLPAILQLAIERRYLEVVVVTTLHKCIMDYGALKIQGPVIEHSRYLTGLSIAGGMTLFTPAISVGKNLLIICLIYLYLCKFHNFYFLVSFLLIFG